MAYVLINTWWNYHYSLLILFYDLISLFLVLFCSIFRVIPCFRLFFVPFFLFSVYVFNYIVYCSVSSFPFLSPYFIFFIPYSYFFIYCLILNFSSHSAQAFFFIHFYSRSLSLLTATDISFIFLFSCLFIYSFFFSKKGGYGKNKRK